MVIKLLLVLSVHPLQLQIATYPFSYPDAPLPSLKEESRERERRKYKTRSKLQSLLEGRIMYTMRFRGDIEDDREKWVNHFISSVHCI